MGEGAPGTDGPLAFYYTNSLGPILWVFVALSAVELVVVHFLLSLWSPTTAAILSAVTLVTTAWLVRLILSFRRYPVLVAADGVTFRIGNMRPFLMPADTIAGVRREVLAEEVRSRSVADFTLVEHPNVLVDLAAPLPWRKYPVRAAAHKLDDPDGFVRAVNALLQARRPD